MTKKDHVTLEYRRRVFTREHGHEPNAVLVDEADLSDYGPTFDGLRVVLTLNPDLHLTPILL